MIQQYHEFVKRLFYISLKGAIIMFTPKRLIILAVLALCGTVAGRLAVRAALNLLLGGTLFGGDFL